MQKYAYTVLKKINFLQIFIVEIFYKKVFSVRLYEIESG